MTAYDTFMAHRSEIVGAARRAPKGYRIWAVLNHDDTWEGIYGPFQNGSYPSRVHRTNDAYISISGGNPFFGHDNFATYLDDLMYIYNDRG